MKRYLVIFLLTLPFTGCETEEVPLYNSPDYISFAIRQQDTVVLSFFLLGNLSEYDYPVVVRYTGVPVVEPRPFAVSVVNESTTMPGDKVSLPPALAFQPMQMLDTFYVKLVNFAELQTTSKMVTIALQENSHFFLGDKNYRVLHLVVNDNVAKPDWWNARVENYFLGAYSDKKFRKLMEIVHPDLSNTSESWIRAWALEFKIYLAQMAEADTPVTEDDGSLMSVTVRM
ncbi:MAG: DUF4843 domain-containing protein [Odoribacteraceae bacterium]|jgi:hypothetical protein|nr:DUF4843 domain-containing protein [Odoribacteraceae bacterium]